MELRQFKQTPDALLYDFLVKSFGKKNVAGFTLLDEKTIGFVVSNMEFFLELDTMSLKRIVDHGIEIGDDMTIRTMLTDETTRLIHSRMKEYFMEHSYPVPETESHTST